MSNKKLYPVYGVIRAFFRMYYFLKTRLNFRKVRKVYVFTDSRGFRVDLWYCKKNPYLSYIAKLSGLYRVDYSLCEYSHTTLIDFLYDFKKIDSQDYDAIVLHTGVVDFSPRPFGQAVAVMAQKADRIQALFGEASLSDFHPQPYFESYNGEKTASLYPLNAFENYILPELNKLSSKLVWVGVSPVLSDWQGNYGRARPVNLNEVIKMYQKTADDIFRGRRIDLSGFTRAQVKSLTVDNIHFSAEGFSYLFSEIDGAIREGS